mmetsp:Transcript_54215/g.154446  ORF Transcript_54215/g.154446 Transcript_54215/m.154446 type:complete len:221 (-) Transcript_54215:975-1637(-)
MSGSSRRTSAGGVKSSQRTTMIGTLFRTAVVISPAHQGRVSVFMLSMTTRFFTEVRTVSKRVSRLNKWSASMNTSAGHLDRARKDSCRARARAPASFFEWHTKKANKFDGNHDHNTIQEAEINRPAIRIEARVTPTMSIPLVSSGGAASNPPRERMRSRHVHTAVSSRFRYRMRQGCQKLSKTMCADRSTATKTNWPGPSSCTITGASVKRRLRPMSTRP